MSANSKKKSPQGKRYTEKERQKVLDFVIAVNTKKGRGGVSAATKKFRISPITINSWIRKSGVTSAVPVKAAIAAPAGRGVSAKTLIAIDRQIAKAEEALAKLQVLFASLK